MRDVNEILSLKERELEKVRAEINALRLIAPLLADDAHHASGSPIASPSKMPVQGVAATEPGKETAAERNMRRWP